VNLKKAAKDIEILLCQLLNSEDKVNVFCLRHLLVSSQLVVLVCEYFDMFLLCSVFRLALLMIREISHVLICDLLGTICLCLFSLHEKYCVMCDVKHLFVRVI
jgi:hypothetical protein